MKKFLVLYRAPIASYQEAMKSTPEQQQAGMQAWMAWAQKPTSHLVDMGAPLGKAIHVAASGRVEPSPNDLGGYSIMQGESKEALAKQLEGHPHYMMKDGWIEIVDIMAIPGM